MAPSPNISSLPIESQGKRKFHKQQQGKVEESLNQKRSRLIAARHVPAQSAEAAMKDGDLDLQAFLAAREFEICSLEQSMATSKGISSTRAFQKVPRGLRRRTASHNPKRIPSRLRCRARREMTEDNTPMVESRKRRPRTTRARIRAEVAHKLLRAARMKKRAKLKSHIQAERLREGEINEGERVIGRTPRPKARQSLAGFRKRQVNKTWLPTHVWHAKRARLTKSDSPLWNFAIPITPNEKIYRSTHRAQGEKGTLIWDVSYMSTISLDGSFLDIRKILQGIGVIQESAWNEKGKKWRQGTRAWYGSLTRRGAENFPREIGPSVVLWNPLKAANQEGRFPECQRQVFVRLHPSTFKETWNTLLHLIHHETAKLQIEDLRFEIGSIELSGPASTEALLCTIKPYAEAEPGSQHASLFGRLRGLSNPASLPCNAVLGFNARYPRSRYLPTRAMLTHGTQTELELIKTVATWPAEDGLAPYLIFNRDARHSASKMPSEGVINRRGGNSNSKSYSKTKTIDPPIPIILCASGPSSSGQRQGSWTLLMPWECILPFWHSFVRCPLSSGGNPRFAGLDEAMQVSLERGLPWFPADYLGTDAGAMWELEQRNSRMTAWEKLPKSKRPDFSRLELGEGKQGEVASALSLDFEHIFDLPVRSTRPTGSHVASLRHDSNNSARFTNQLTQHVEQSLEFLYHMPRQDFGLHLSEMPPPLPAYAIITVRISLSGRGIPKSCARIYRLPRKPSGETARINLILSSRTPSLSRLPLGFCTEPLRHLSSKLPDHDPPKRVMSCQERKRLLAQTITGVCTSTKLANSHDLVPDERDLIGYVTRGSFCLSDGKGVAIGSIAVEKVVKDIQRNGREEASLCLIHNVGEEVVLLGKWEAL